MEEKVFVPLSIPDLHHKRRNQSIAELTLLTKLPWETTHLQLSPLDSEAAMYVYVQGQALFYTTYSHQNTVKLQLYKPPNMLLFSSIPNACLLIKPF